MGYDIQMLKISWNAVDEPVGGGPVSYKVFQDMDGKGPVAETQVATGIAATRLDHSIQKIYDYLNATYTVKACNTAGCGPASAPLGVDVNRFIGFFKASNAAASTRFGWAVALSENGNTFAVGSHFEKSNASGVNGDQTNQSLNNAGAVYVFTRTAGVWAQQAYVKASNPRSYAQFGSTLSLSADGNTLAVGSPFESSKATGIDGDQGDTSATGAGAVYVFTRSGSTWSQQAYVKASNTDAGDQFGGTVSLSAAGDLMAVSAGYEASKATGIGGDQADNSEPNTGAVYVFARTGVTWSQQAYVKAGTYTPSSSPFFGTSVAVSGDGGTLAVGSGGDSLSRGAVWVYLAAGNSWVQQAKVTARNGEGSDRFGESIALSADGNTLAAGAPSEFSKATGINGDELDNSASFAGAAYVFTRTGVTWSQQAYIKASNTDARDKFGTAVGLSSDGNTLLVGAPFEASASAGIGGTESDNSGGFVGAAYLFKRTGSEWHQQAYLKPLNISSSAPPTFGLGLAVSADGSTLAVGAYADNSNWIGINGDKATQTTVPTSGAAYIY
ncbi:MAG: integrin [Comamonadaceae bacterium]|nr:MAG: integrin [Comamonadaceae bacterium]